MADIFDAIADGTRREILQLLLSRSSGGTAGTSVSHIVQELGVSQPTVSKHLKVLREAELVSVREDGQHRFYSLESEPLEAIDDWLVPFFIDETDMELYAASSVGILPEQAAHAAEVVGRAAASTKRAVQSVFESFDKLRDRPTR